MSRLYEKYKNEIVSELQSELGIKNKMAVPRLEKIVLNMGAGDAIQNIKLLDAAKAELAQITGQL
ncbi:MAG TPA: 50S ribosomal protein L5, partial [Candidatus Aminicenantes bacterium]|nr:50S ribosomal protein L5 [Candidatus Aminicenantes bacterium]